MMASKRARVRSSAADNRGANEAALASGSNNAFMLRHRGASAANHYLPFMM
jgi:hypothetical protein